MLDKIILKGKEVQMSDDEFLAFCQANPELNIERSPQREIIIIPDEETVYIYEAGKPVRQHKGFREKLPADPVLPGFSLDLSKLSLP